MLVRLATVLSLTFYCLGCVPHTDEAPVSSAPSTTPAPSAAAPAPSGTPAPSGAAAAPAAPVGTTTQSDANLAATPAAAAAPPPSVLGQPINLGSNPAGAPADTAAAPPATAPDSAATEQVKATAGVGLKGQSLKNETGILVEPAKAFFNVQQRVVFEMEIPKALQLYSALEGRGPQSHDEFMSKIIAANNIKLPQLPAGNRYIYDPQKQELMVERPAAR